MDPKVALYEVDLYCVLDTCMVTELAHLVQEGKDRREVIYLDCGQFVAGQYITSPNFLPIYSRGILAIFSFDICNNLSDMTGKMVIFY